MSRKQFSFFKFSIFTFILLTLASIKCLAASAMPTDPMADRGPTVAERLSDPVMLRSIAASINFKYDDFNAPPRTGAGISTTPTEVFNKSLVPPTSEVLATVDPVWEAVHIVGTKKMDPDRLREILIPKQAYEYERHLWPLLPYQALLAIRVQNGKATVLVSFNSTETQDAFKTLRAENASYELLVASHPTPSTNDLLASFFLPYKREESALSDLKMIKSFALLALYFQQDILKVLNTCLTERLISAETYDFIITGHGLAGGLAQAFAPILYQWATNLTPPQPHFNIILFGAPMVYSFWAAQYMRERFGPEHIGVFAIRAADPKSILPIIDPFSLYPVTPSMAGGTLEPFSWTERGTRLEYAQGHNAWSTLADPILLATTNKKPFSAPNYSIAIEHYIPSLRRLHSPPSTIVDPSLITADVCVSSSSAAPGGWLKSLLSLPSTATSWVVDSASAAGSWMTDKAYATAKATGKIAFRTYIESQRRQFAGCDRIFQNIARGNRDALRLLSTRSEQDSIAKGYLAILQAYGIGTLKNLEEAKKLASEVFSTVEEWAEYDVADAQVLVGVMIETGLGLIKTDTDTIQEKYPHTRASKAEEYYTRATKTESPEAFYRLGILKRNQGKMPEAISALRTAAGVYSHPHAINALGEMCYNAEGEFRTITPPAARLIEARMRFEEAARQGSTDARTNLARMHFKNEIEADPTKNKEDAVTLLTYAAAQGNISAKELLGTIKYQEGNYEQAFRYFHNAITTSSEALIGEGAGVLLQADTAAVAETNFKLSLMYRLGHTIDGKRDEALANMHLKKAFDLGHEEATVLLTNSSDLALQLKRAAILNKIGHQYWRGEDVVRDLNAANFHLLEAIRLSHTNAWYPLALVRLEAYGEELARKSTEESASSTASPLARGFIKVGSMLAPPPPSATAAPIVSPRKTLIKNALTNAEKAGNLEAASLLVRIGKEGLDKVALSIYTERRAHMEVMSPMKSPAGGAGASASRHY